MQRNSQPASECCSATSFPLALVGKGLKIKETGRNTNKLHIYLALSLFSAIFVLENDEPASDVIGGGQREELLDLHLSENLQNSSSIGEGLNAASPVVYFLACHPSRVVGKDYIYGCGLTSFFMLRVLQNLLKENFGRLTPSYVNSFIIP